MAVEINDAANTGAPAGSGQSTFGEATQGAFAGVDMGRAATGSNDLLMLSQMIGVTRISPDVEPYIERAMKVVKTSLPSAELDIFPTLNNGYAVRYASEDGVTNFFGLQFATIHEARSHGTQYPLSTFLYPLIETIKKNNAGREIRVLDARLLIAGYNGDMDRAENMGATIVQFMKMATLSFAKSFGVDFLKNHEFDVSWSLSDVKAAENMWSSHGVRPRCDLGAVLRVKVKQDFGLNLRGIDNLPETWTPIGVIGGFIEMREKEPSPVANGHTQLLYKPVFNMTVCNAIIPHIGIGAMLMATIAPAIRNSLWWTSQWNDLGENRPNPGMLEENPEDRGRPYVLQSREELAEFVRTYFSTPVIAVQFQDGKDCIPGMRSLISNNPSDKADLLNTLAAFFGSPDTSNGAVQLSIDMGTYFEGAYGDASGNLIDSREIDYLSVTGTRGFGAVDADMRRVLLGGGQFAQERVRYLKAVTDTFMPLYNTAQALVNYGFIEWIIVHLANNNIRIIDPTSRGDIRTINSMMMGANFSDGSALGSIVQQNAPNRGLPLGTTVWNNNFG